MTPDQILTYKLLHDGAFQDFAGELLAQGYNADHVYKAFMIFDGFEAGEWGGIKMTNAMKTIQFLEDNDFIFEQVWQPRWKEWSFGPRWAWFGPAGSGIVFTRLPKSIAAIEEEMSKPRTEPKYNIKL